MPALRALAAATFAVSLLLATPADALPESCKDIKKGDKDACAKEAAEKCGAIEDYWTKVKCEGELAQKHSACVSGDYLTACQQPVQDYWEVCRKAGELDMNDASSVDAWKGRVVEYEQRVKGSYKAFHDEWSVCFNTMEACQASTAWLDDCERAGDEFKKAYAEAVDFFLATGLAQTRGRIDEALKGKDFAGAAQWAEWLSQRIMVFHDLNKELESVRYKSAEIEKALAEVKASHKKAQKGYAKALANRTCPAATHQDASLVGTLRPSVDGFFHDFGDTSVKVKVFRLTGEKATQTKLSGKLTEESVPGVVCTEKKTPIETYCQSFNVTLRRQKLKDHPWTDWRVFVGGGERLLCAKVK